jgi:hypothetical protein
LTGIAGLLQVRECPHGLGVFALRRFDEGDLIQSIGNMIVTTSPSSPPWKRWALIIGNAPSGEHLFWDEEPEGSPDYWSNYLDHSVKSNVRFVIDVSMRSARLVATESIGPGEELFLNYKEYHADNLTPA